MNTIIEKIRQGEIDVNNQELFFSLLIKGLLFELNNNISIRQIKVPHYIVHMGNDIMYLENKGQDYSIEPYSISNENYIYSIIPRCIIKPGGIDLVPDQLTNPYALGHLQIEQGQLYDLTAEFRRLPIKLSVDLKYTVGSYHDLLELTQQILSKLAFIRTYKITYLGQSLICSYKIPESFSGEYLTEIDGKTQEEKNHNLSIAIEIESCLPIYNQATVMLSDNFIKSHKHSIIENNIKI